MHIQNDMHALTLAVRTPTLKHIRAYLNTLLLRPALRQSLNRRSENGMFQSIRDSRSCCSSPGGVLPIIRGNAHFLAASGAREGQVRGSAGAAVKKCIWRFCVLTLNKCVYHLHIGPFPSYCINNLHDFKGWDENQRIMLLDKT